jgi:hypothetical protein
LDVKTLKFGEMYPLGNPDNARLAPVPRERRRLGGGKSQTRGDAQQAMRDHLVDCGFDYLCTDSACAALDHCQRRAAGEPAGEAGEDQLIEFAANYGQSLDWIVPGDLDPTIRRLSAIGRDDGDRHRSHVAT